MKFICVAESIHPGLLAELLNFPVWELIDKIDMCGIVSSPQHANIDRVSLD